MNFPMCLKIMYTELVVLVVLVMKEKLFHWSVWMSTSYCVILKTFSKVKCLK